MPKDSNGRTLLDKIFFPIITRTPRYYKNTKVRFVKNGTIVMEMNV